MYEEVKEEIKICEGYVPKIYKCSEGFDTIFYGHKITPEDQYEHGVEYSKEEGELVFERDFQRTLDAAERLIGERSINNTAKEVIINMVYQIGEGGVSKFNHIMHLSFFLLVFLLCWEFVSPKENPSFEN